MLLVGEYVFLGHIGIGLAIISYIVIGRYCSKEVEPDEFDSSVLYLDR
jgi:hypothetical protein